jgi:multiple sugar transport system ATP-binding protein
MAQVKLKQVWKIYDGDVVAVENFNLTVKDHEFLVLVGPSGCGKSTTLRMVAGLEEISKGEVRIGERVVNDVPPKDRDIAMVFQNYALYPHMTVYENMAFGLKLRKIARDKIEKRVKEAAGILGLEKLLDRRPKALSGGQRQRVAMGRAIVREPAVFLFDEPLSNLDAKMRVEMRREILHLQRRLNATIIYVTHDQVEAMTLGDRICVMRDGVIEQVGTPTQVFDHPATMFVARFIGSPPTNLFEGKVAASGPDLTFESDSIQVNLPAELHAAAKQLSGKDAHLGLRPRAFTLKEDSSEEQQKCVISGKVDVTEMLGEELLVHLTAGPHSFVISVDPHKRNSLGETVEICPVMKMANIFDSRTEKNISL